ncbi:MAG: xanthine dehydrogenase family protein subunit M [Acidaminobacteraceae bacterium]
MNEYEYFKPESLKEASELLLKYSGEASILNGGTDIIVRMRDNHLNPKALVDIKGISELSKLTFDEVNGLFIGAAVNLNVIGDNADVQKHYPYFAQAAFSIGSRQVRNRATCIGNICNASPLADTATPLVSLNATVLIYGPDGEKEVPITEFFVFVRKTILKNGEIVKGIKVPFSKDAKGIFSKMSRRREVDLSTVCSTVIKDNDKYMISFGAVAPTPIRAPKTEEYLNNNTLSESVIEKACEIVSNEIAPIDDIRASKEYRKEMARVMLKRSLSEFI